MAIKVKVKKAKPSTPRYSLSPSRIARYFYHECERYLRYHATPKALRTQAEVPKIPWNQSPVTEAILAGGFAWEEKVITEKLGKRVKIAKGRGKLHERAHDSASSLDILQKMRPGQAVYQPTLQVPASFLETYNLSPDICEFPPCRPDLLQVDREAGQKVPRVIDIKASSAHKASHRMQATLYALMLQEIIAANNLDL